jgi:hypothetical protein
MSALAQPLEEPLSPELVLVADDLREAAIAALPARVWQTYAPALTAQADEPAAAPLISVSIVPQMLLYIAWHALIGVFFGFGVFITVVLGLVLLHVLVLV